MADNKTIVLQFNDCINNRDIDGLFNLMANDYTFIDSANTVRRGKETGIKDWLSFFQMFPDYRNIFEELRAKDDIVTVLGYSTCPDERLSGPAIWTAKLKDGKIAEWRVYEDNSEIRRSLMI